MSLSFVSISRTVLMISDEALYIYSVNVKGVKTIDVVPWDAESFEINVANIISNECGGKPVVILNDMVEQHYRKEKIPNISVIDKQRVVDRKLKVAFPTYPVRAALPLKGKISKTDISLAGNLYIFAAIPASVAFAKTMAAARLSLANIAGFYLLPVEASDMVKKLSEKLVGKDASKSRWTIFMGQHKSGGLRQVVIRNGEIALTRMTPISGDSEDSKAWAAEVNQEFQATMSYLSRFGFDKEDGLDVILISDPSAGDVVGELIETECGFYSLTLSGAADLLGITLGDHDSDKEADILQAAWIGRKSKFILPMKAEEIDNVSRPRKISAFLTMLLLIGVGVQAYQLFNYYNIMSKYSFEMRELSERKAQIDLEYGIEVKRKEDLGFDIQLIQSSLALHDSFESSDIDVIPLFYNIGMALGADLRIDRLEVSHAKGSIKRILGVDDKIPSYEASMQMTFPSKADIAKGNAQVRKLQTTLQNRMPDHVVRITKLLEEYEYIEELVVETGEMDTEQISQDYIVEISIEGPAK